MSKDEVQNLSDEDLLKEWEKMKQTYKLRLPQNLSYQESNILFTDFVNVSSEINRRYHTSDSKPKSAGVWVKCSERLPEKNIPFHAKLLRGEKLDEVVNCSGLYDGKEIFLSTKHLALSYSEHYFYKISWLDESNPIQKEDEWGMFKNDFMNYATEQPVGQLEPSWDRKPWEVLEWLQTHYPKVNP